MLTMMGWHSHSQFSLHSPLPLLAWHILIRNGSILIRIGIAGIVIVVALSLALSLALSVAPSLPLSLTLPATVWFPFDADKL